MWTNLHIKYGKYNNVAWFIYASDGLDWQPLLTVALEENRSSMPYTGIDRRVSTLAYADAVY